MLVEVLLRSGHSSATAEHRAAPEQLFVAELNRQRSFGRLRALANLYRVEVLLQEAMSVRLRLQLTRSADGVVPVGQSFASMLVEEEASPAHAAWRLWINARYAEDEDFDPAKSISAVAIVAVHGCLGEASGTDDDDFFGAVDLEIRTTTAGRALLHQMASELRFEMVRGA